MVPSSTFCILPWTHLFVSVEGRFYPCCRCVDAELPNVDPSGMPFIFADQASVQTAWNSKYMRNLRRDMLSGRRPLPCKNCYAVEDLGIESDRLRLNKLYDRYLDSPEFHPSEDGSAPLKVKTLDLRLSNLCNLRCRMCSPRASRALSQEFRDLYNIRSDVGRPNTGWAGTVDAMAMIEELGSQVDEIQFAGGEPLLIPEMYDILERFVISGHASKISLAYITNLTTISPLVRELWPQFKSVRLSISLDGYQSVNSYIRYPSEWVRMHDNLHVIDQNFRALNCISARIFTAVQLYNIFSLEKLLDYVFTEFTNIDPLPNLIIVREPRCFDVQVLPRDLKVLMTTRYRDYKRFKRGMWLERASANQVTDFEAKLEAVLRHMNEADASHRLMEFYERTARHDQYRGQAAREMLPELAPLLMRGSSAKG